MRITLPPHALVADKEHPQGWLELGVAHARALVHDLEDAIEQEEARSRNETVKLLLSIPVGGVVGVARDGTRIALARVGHPLDSVRFMQVDGNSHTADEWVDLFGVTR